MDVRVFYVAGLFALIGCNETADSSSMAESKRITGKELYLQRCTACHGSDGKLGASGAKDLTVTKMDDTEIREIILDGKNAMPPFKHQIESEERLNEMVEFVKSLNK